VAEVSITDDGVGIEPSDLPSIFDPFFTTKSLGTGLGLTNARKVVELHRGAIEVSSEVGRGTKVTVLLPYEPLEGSEAPENDEVEREVEEPARASVP
jgi:signal transduction histidine kinase